MLVFSLNSAEAPVAGNGVKSIVRSTATSLHAVQEESSISYLLAQYVDRLHRREIAAYITTHIYLAEVGIVEINPESAE
jgi:hypothetical protein